ncbi:MAG: PQQ-binding-like beta-propeller repeat protein [Planctomycetales bacterium]|nr:PQQ-binding-like beta-propeller repeat protein [Planctomycetales bacterium]
MRRHGAFGIPHIVAPLLALVVGFGGSLTQAADWPNWRGPAQDSSSRETGLIEEWSPKGGDGSNLVWKRTDLGTRSTPIVLNGKLYCLVRDKPGTENEGEKVVCVDAESGESQWEHRFNVYLSDVPDTRVAWSCVTGDPATGRIYAQGVCGYFCCLDGASGKVVWERSLTEEFGVITTFGGRTNVPVIYEDLVLISAVVVGWGDTPEFGGLAKPAHRFMAFDKETGEIRWLNGTNISPYDTTYSTPTTAVIGGQAQLVFGSGDGQVWGFRPRTGERLWNFPLSKRGLNVPPLVEGDHVYMSHSEENAMGATMGAVVKLDATQRGDLSGKADWIAARIMSGKSAPVMVDGLLWTVDDRAKLHILDPQTGKELGKKALGTAMRSTPLFADGKVYTCTNGGRWYILRPKTSGKKASVETVQSLRLDGDANDGSPIVANGLIYLPTSEAIYCLGTPGQTSNAASKVAGPKEQGADDTAPAWVQVTPYDALLKPGEQQQFTARLYNASGQFLRIASDGEASFEAKGPGSISPNGQFTAGNEGHAAAVVTCKIGSLQGTARVRIVPPLPWSWDFNTDKDLPITWVGGRVRYVLREVAGERAAVKRSVLPTPVDPDNKLGTRSQAFMGPIDLQNYTIQADVQVTEDNGRMPDVGLINSGYTFTLRSQNEELRVYSWTSHDYRTSASSKFVPKTGVWYRMKLRVDQQGDEALVRCKAWPRDKQEPEQWTLEMTDATPQRQGSPGIYGNSQEAEFYIDNVSVTAN